MGLLEDAIREHLELKRRHGAGEDEVRRQEVEALGPVRRGVESAGEAEEESAAEEALAAEEARAAEEEHAVAEAAAPDDVSELFDLDRPREDASRSETQLLEPDELEELAPARGTTPPEGVPSVGDEERLKEEEEPFADEEPLADEEPATEDESSSEEAPSEGEEDVLEETPEFLQDTPEHDRLWFEQKPPRDFDFD
jgi:hypothetical protein